MPPSRVDAFDVYEFHVIIAEEKGLFTAVGWDSGRKEIARITSSNLDDLRNDIKRLLSEKSEQFVGYAGAINQFRRVFPDGFLRTPFFSSMKETTK
jgi:hypothetical protein